MKHNLELPADLQHLLEKRAKADRRKKQRRTTTGSATPGTEQRASADRRKQTRRPPKKNS
ncbi:MAG TPA: hypothetical protein VM165_08630 [Planctomycetaceae bacterium]|nr:hypothetical protein [Planctomycetaceae bacterium]